MAIHLYRSYTVEELIEELQKYPLDAKIVVNAVYGGWTDDLSVEEDEDKNIVYIEVY